MPHLIRQVYRKLLPHETRLWLYRLRHPKEFERLRSIVYPSPNGDFSLKPFDEHQCIFVHITKTAGTSVAKSLFGYLPYHYTATDYRVIYGRRTFNRYFKFAFVRNPWDRLYSAYRYLKSGGWNDKDRRWAEENLRQYDDFNDFVLNWLTPDNINTHIHFWPQHQFICDRAGRFLIDHLAYFETLAQDFDKICAKLHLSASIGHHNANPGNHYTTVYSPEAKRRVAQVYADDIRLFGYGFDGIEERTVLSTTTFDNTHVIKR